ncbi:monocarboxylate transporter 12 [Aplysia californica]|uniref:Monocarboxylate transporter 12 n=1 Tax=Aplysia californica TaxID=6500 RepID=A0ABM1A9F3_APLCA|nr:monocarboxylate transporter 12 [Aplysia californica]
MTVADSSMDESTQKSAQNGAVVPDTSAASSGKSTEQTSDSQQQDEGYIKPPDGGWGIMVVISSFLIHVIADGVVYSFGVFLTEFVHYFDTGRGAASWIGSLQPAVTFTVGPLSSALTNKYGCRIVTIAGAIVAGLGFVLSVFAPNLYYLYFTAGIMAGVGFGLIYLPAIVCVAQYFEKYRSFATGLAVCGSGFGTMFMAPLTEMLVVEYQWQGAMLILGGVILNVIVCGILFRPLEASPGSGGKRGAGSASLSSAASSTEEERLLGTSGATGDSDTATTPPPPGGAKSGGGGGGAGIGQIQVLVEKDLDPSRRRGEGEDGNRFTAAQGLEIIHSLQQRHALPNGKAVLLSGKPDTGSDVVGPRAVSVSSLQDDRSDVASPPSEMVRMNSLVETVTTPGSLPLSLGVEEVRRLTASQSLVPADTDSVSEIANMVRSEGALNKFSALSPSDGAGGGGAGSTAVRQRHIHPSQQQGRHHHGGSSNTLSPLTRKDIFYSGSLLNIPMYRSQPDVYKTTVSTSLSHEHIRPREERGGGAGKGEGEGGVSCLCFNFSEEFRTTMRDMLSTELLKNPVFLMFAVSNFFTSIGFNMPFIFLPDRAILAGIDKDRATMLISVIGIANTAGRVIFGFLSDRPWVNRLMLYNTALTICGVATALSPLAASDYALLVTYAAVFGIFIGVYVSLTSVVLVDLLGLEYLTNSFGLLLLFQGAATFIGPPIAGWLCDWTGSYDISFIVMGILIAVSGAMLYFLPLVERYYQRKVPMVNLVRDMELGKHSVSENTDGKDSQIPGERV